MTFRSGPLKTQINYFLIRASSRSVCKDCKVLPREFLGTQYRLLVLDVDLRGSKWKRSAGEPRIKW